MRIQADKLGDHLAKQLAACYVISGDEPLQVGECCDAIRATAREQGYTTRDVLDVSSGFDWQQLAAEAAAMSLFAERKIIDLRVANGKPGAEGSRALSAYCDNPPPDTLLLVTLPKLDRQQPNSKWYKALDALGVTVQVWPIEPARLPAWIEQRLKHVGITPTNDATHLLAERVEGNLLAAHQEIDKLVLLHGTGPLDAEQLAKAVADSARYDVFELVDTVLRGDPARAMRIIAGLRGEGVAPAVVLWALHREARNMAQIATDVAKGMPADHAINRAGVYRKRIGLVGQALKRLRAPQWLALLDTCQASDAAIKGIGYRPAWLLIEEIAMTMCGVAPASKSTG